MRWKLTALPIMSFALLLAGCASKPVVKKEQLELGWVDRTVLQSPGYAWFDSGYTSYNASLDMLEDMQLAIDSIRFLVVFGTWCEDSRREMPRFFKIADGLNVREDHIQLYGVDRSKQHPEGIPQKYNITNVPTIILLHNGKEMGRIVESPKMTIELDLLEILLPLTQ